MQRKMLTHTVRISYVRSALLVRKRSNAVTRPVCQEHQISAPTLRTTVFLPSSSPKPKQPWVLWRFQLRSIRAHVESQRLGQDFSGLRKSMGATAFSQDFAGRFDVAPTTDLHQKAPAVTRSHRATRTFRLLESWNHLSQDSKDLNGCCRCLDR
jgi:hypothetical protein